MNHPSLRSLGVSPVPLILPESPVSAPINWLTQKSFFQKRTR